MPVWLGAALRDSSQVVTASRRLARYLRAEHSASMLAAGATAWRSPEILFWQDWLSQLVADSDAPAELPLIITAQQSRVLWERCLRREIADPLLNIGMLARQCRETWKRLREWRVDQLECQRAARNRDQQLFAKASANYLSILQQEHWLDDAGLADMVLQKFLDGRIHIDGKLTLAGFDRLAPQQRSLLAAIEQSGTTVAMAPESAKARELSLHVAENRDAELRTAGAWARQQLLQNPASRVAIVVTRLEQDAARSLRLVKEGLLPGWQNAAPRESGVVNVSYGRKLIDYPAISMALLALRWLYSDLSSVEVSRFLRSNLLDMKACEELTRVELRLRQQPDQSWTPRRLLAEISAACGVAEDDVAVNRIRCIAEYRAEMPKRQSPTAWVAFFDAVLRKLSWPGESPLDSNEFQLLNRWRELLNDVARLELVSATMTAGEASGRIAAIAGETVYQPESEQASVQLMGPLEAAGLTFDQLWITGVSDRDWPAASRPMSLVSRELQRSHGMPDATPADTLEFARRVLRRLTASAPQIVVSYPSADDDVQQSASELLQEFTSLVLADAPDPGWHARSHGGAGAQLVRLPDPVPPVTASEKIAGGAATLQRQHEDPFSAFVTGRLGVRVLWPIAAGLPAIIRGNLIHAALHRLYEMCPARNDIREWIGSGLDARLEQAVHAAFRAQERNADAVQQRLLQLEKARVKNLLQGVVELDASRDFVRVQAVEQKLDIVIEGLHLRVRLDRVDRSEAGEAIIIDYKTGASKALLDRDRNPKDLQLLVYARAIPGPVGAIGLFNVDSRAIALDAIGRQQLPDADWDAQLAEWQAPLTRAAAQMAAGDVRVGRWQTSRSGRAFALLSRFQELRLDQ